MSKFIHRIHNFSGQGTGTLPYFENYHITFGIKISSFSYFPSEGEILISPFESFTKNRDNDWTLQGTCYHYFRTSRLQAVMSMSQKDCLLFQAKLPKPAQFSEGSYDLFEDPNNEMSEGDKNKDSPEGIDGEVCITFNKKNGGLK
ncbi:hypothetical protein HELRODRAFT_181332 [Helobdella robusta]|uniref:NAD(P)(+)--arginine ADP-ribosyltransferase n=1 Tax=Helobdella robusta TaxID=6412 RepID=T1FGW5_HELRO|nr:hypothetical protein HELRODRAFT_181332 [Helobdella robusta]ESN92460.1 hypothetical protein HELRODRAFT_181332 [Helobdella robusta]